MIEFGVSKFLHFGMKRFDLARRDALPRNVVQGGDGSGVGGLEPGYALDQRRHLMAEQSQVGRTRRNCFQRFKAGFDSIEARFDAAEAGFDAAEAAIDRTQEAQDFRVGHRRLLPHFTSADYDIPGFNEDSGKMSCVWR